MQASTIYSIGYGNRNPETFIALLKQNGITTLVDIRTKPVSRFQPHYSKTRLHALLLENGIDYVFMGESLGGKPKAENLYVNGAIDYTLVNTTPTYQNGIKRLITLAKPHLPICIMCCELSPAKCHRKLLIGETLYGLDIAVKHIDERGFLTTHGPKINFLLL